MKLASILLPGEVAPWSALGFTADDNARLCFANGAIEFGVERPELTVDGSGAEGVRHLPTDVEGIPVRRGFVVPGADHRNGAVELDHLVIMTPSLEHTSSAIVAALGLEQRRVRETPDVRQAFHRFNDHDGARGCIIEVVENERIEHSGIWGLVMIVDDLDAAVAAAPDVIGQPKPAVQAGRRIATVSRAAGLTTAVALMTR